MSVVSEGTSAARLTMTSEVRLCLRSRVIENPEAILPSLDQDGRRANSVHHQASRTTVTVL